MDKKLVLILSGIFLLAVTGTVGLMLFINGRGKSSEKARVASTPRVVASPKVQPSPEEANVTFGITPPKQSVTKGQKVTFVINVESQEQLLGADLDIKYNQSVLKFASLEPLKFFASPMQFSKSIDETAGKIFYSLGSIAPATGKGQLVGVSFTAIQNSFDVAISLGNLTLASIKADKKVKVVLPTN